LSFCRLPPEKFFPSINSKGGLLPFFWRTKNQEPQLSGPQTRFAAPFGNCKLIQNASGGRQRYLGKTLFIIDN